MKRAAAVFLALLFLALCTVSVAETDNLLSNGGFENVLSSGMPEQWYSSAYRSQPGYSRMAITDEKAHTGKYSAVVENASPNDARFICTVKVKPESMYRLSGYVLVDSMEDTGNGANFGIENIYSFSDTLFDTNGEWQYLEWYGETGEDQNEVTIGVRVGGYSAESTGKAYFDDITLEEVNTLPEGVVASLWYDAYSRSADNSSEQGASSDKNTILFVVLALLFAAAVYFLQPSFDKEIKETYVHVVFAVVVVVALMLRFLLAVLVPGYQVDINCFRAWSLRMADVGPAGFYAADYFCDYPPGAMLLLWPIGLLQKTVGLHNTDGILIAVKLLPILCDVITAYLVYCYGRKRLGSFSSCLIAAAYLFAPAVLVNGAAWGQMDSVLALLILLTTIYAMESKWQIAIPMFVISALVKPQALLFAPLGATALMFDIFKHQKAERTAILRRVAYGVCGAVGAALLIIVPFSLKKDEPIGWLFELYVNTLGSYAYATLNTANLYYLAGANWASLTQQVPAALFLCSIIVFLMAGAFVFFKKESISLQNTRKRAAFVGLFSGVAVLLLLLWMFGGAYNGFGYTMMIFAYCFAVLCYIFDQENRKLPFYMALSLICIYVLGIKVHERYLFTALVLLLIAYCQSRDRRLIGLFVGFSVTTFINTAIVLENSILFGAEMGHLNQDTLFLNRLLCVVNLLLCGFAGWIGISGLYVSKPQGSTSFSQPEKNKRVQSYADMLLHPRDHRLHLSIRDYMIMGITTLLYAFLAFYQLGSTVAPQTAWVSTSENESVVFELDESTEFSVMYYAGVSYRDFAFAVSDDGVNWSETYPCEMREGLCYRWNYALKTTDSGGKTVYPACKPSNVLWLKGKYLRLDACDAGLNLWEVVARNENGENIPLRITDHIYARAQLLNESKPVTNLIDEQETCVGEPSWFNGTYFDEIYHARTAYEHLHGQSPYETTHPPLGKLMMSAAIALFGMTPFGWRFAGALIGVLMLPAIYLLAMQLVHKRSVAVVSMLALTFDLMHFTQTRIATIDSFPVFFILLTYLLMVRYMQMDAFAVSDPVHPKLFDKAYVKTLMPLLLCGICMGLSIACKWIGIYSAVGLAILFFLTMYRNARVCETAWLEDESVNNCAEMKSRILAARSFTLYRIGITCCFCVLFFVAIPCLIYALSYIPYLAPTGPVTLKRIIWAQKSMLSYHGEPGRGMDHPFYSPWWQWPLLLRPMWFVQDQFEPAGYASTILCFGNPWVFYIGAFAMVAVVIGCVCKYLSLCDGKVSLRQGNGDLTLVVLTIGFLVQYLPWVLVPRGTYMYHYFASVPFIILATAVLLEWVSQKKNSLRWGLIAIYLVGTIVFFVMFFPYASGYLTSTKWLDAMKWFSKLYY